MDFIPICYFVIPSDELAVFPLEWLFCSFLGATLFRISCLYLVMGSQIIQTIKTADCRLFQLEFLASLAVFVLDHPSDLILFCPFQKQSAWGGGIAASSKGISLLCAVPCTNDFYCLVYVWHEWVGWVFIGFSHWPFSHWQSSTRIGGVSLYSGCEIWLWGDKNCNLLSVITISFLSAIPSVTVSDSIFEITKV